MAFGITSWHEIGDVSKRHVGRRAGEDESRVSFDANPMVDVRRNTESERRIQAKVTCWAMFGGDTLGGERCKSNA